jgi:magnesium-transporting ATPase (P-type)
MRFLVEISVESLGDNESRQSKNGASTTNPVVGTDLKDMSHNNLKKKLRFAPDGLASNEVQRRLQVYGYNELIEKNENPALEFFSYFWRPIPIMIMAAAGTQVAATFIAVYGLFMSALGWM